MNSSSILSFPEFTAGIRPVPTGQDEGLAGRQIRESRLLGIAEFDGPLGKRLKAIGTRWDYRQSWRPGGEEAHFAPGSVYIGRRGVDLLVLADFEDVHVTNTVFPWNYQAFLESDTFEIFLHSSKEKFYHELHITPSNSCLQLRFDLPRTSGFRGGHLVSCPLFKSSTQIVGKGWRVLAGIPLDLLTLRVDRDWKLSFGRYDHTPDKPPVISSTSPHRLADFHRLAEWRSIKFTDLPEI